METLADALQARSCAYRLLAFFMALPTRDVADSVLAGSLRADVEEIADGANFDPEEARRVTEALDAENSFWQLDAEEALRALRLDYTMLFTNPEGAVVSPYEACFKGSDERPYVHLAHGARRRARLPAAGHQAKRTLERVGRSHGRRDGVSRLGLRAACWGS